MFKTDLRFNRKWKKSSKISPTKTDLTILNWVFVGIPTIRFLFLSPCANFAFEKARNRSPIVACIHHSLSLSHTPKRPSTTRFICDCSILIYKNLPFKLWFSSLPSRLFSFEHDITSPGWVNLRYLYSIFYYLYYTSCLVLSIHFEKTQVLKSALNTHSFIYVFFFRRIFCSLFLKHQFPLKINK